MSRLRRTLFLLALVAAFAGATAPIVGAGSDTAGRRWGVGAPQAWLR
jgi:hypothetical protein